MSQSKPIKTKKSPLLCIVDCKKGKPVYSKKQETQINRQKMVRKREKRTTTAGKRMFQKMFFGSFQAKKHTKMRGNGMKKSQKYLRKENAKKRTDRDRSVRKVDNL